MVRGFSVHTATAKQTGQEKINISFGVSNFNLKWLLKISIYSIDAECSLNAANENCREGGETGRISSNFS